jgi:hypothetical protein
VLILLGGVLVGGVISLRQQKAPLLALIVTGVLAALAIAAGVLWQL